jgi:hypothetical protein
MRKIFVGFILALFAISGLSAQMTFSGILDSTVAFTAGAGDSPAFSYGVEEFANIRFQSRLRDNRGTFSGAMNLLAVTGSYAAGLAMSGYPIGENFIAAIELERLQLRLRGEHIDFDGGLMRLPFGYSQVWGPSDFLNPRNPLKPDARPRGIICAAFTWYPIDELKLLGFLAAPRNPLAFEGDGSFAGLSMDRHWEKVSIQAMYSFETPATGDASAISSKWGIHRAGLSVKLDVEVGIVMDALYTYNHEAGTRLDGLSFSVGADYSFFDGNLMVIAEYLYNGKTSSTAFGHGGSFFNNHYLSTGFLYRFNDFTNMNLALISGISRTPSFMPIISLNHELFQGATLTISAQVPIDRYLFTGNENHRGEFGPIPHDNFQPLENFRFGSYFSCTARVRIRF